MGNNQQQSCKVHVGLKRNPQMGHINCSRAQWHTDQKIAAVSANGFAFSASNVANWNLPAHDSRPYIPSIKHHESSKTILCFVHYSHISQRGRGKKMKIPYALLQHPQRQHSMFLGHGTLRSAVQGPLAVLRTHTATMESRSPAYIGPIKQESPSPRAKAQTSQFVLKSVLFDNYFTGSSWKCQWWVFVKCCHINVRLQIQLGHMRSNPEIVSTALDLHETKTVLQTAFTTCQQKISEFTTT